jgi:hypothetical protein
MARRTVDGAVMKRLVLFGACLQGCYFGSIVHHDRNAPPEVDTRSPEPEEPRDPGMRSVVAAVRTVGGFGYTTGGRGGTAGSSHAGVEGHLLFGATPEGARPQFRAGPQLIPPLLDYYPVWQGAGLDFGWAPIRDDDRYARLYMEAYLIRVPFTLGGGWAWEPNGPGKGPQATLWFGPIFLRAAFLGNVSGTESVLGLALSDLWMAQGWSR